MGAEVPLEDPRLTSPDILVRIEAKQDALLARDLDTQAAGLIGTINGILSAPIVRGFLIPAGSLAALAWAGMNGYLTSDQQKQAAEVVIAAAAPGSAPGVLAPQPVPVVAPVVVEVAPVVVPVAPPADVPAPMAPTE